MFTFHSISSHKNTFAAEHILFTLSVFMRGCTRTHTHPRARAPLSSTSLRPNPSQDYPVGSVAIVSACRTPPGGSSRTSAPGGRGCRQRHPQRVRTSGGAAGRISAARQPPGAGDSAGARSGRFSFSQKHLSRGLS